METTKRTTTATATATDNEYVPPAFVVRANNAQDDITMLSDDKYRYRLHDDDEAESRMSRVRSVAPDEDTVQSMNLDGFTVTERIVQPSNNFDHDEEDDEEGSKLGSVAPDEDIVQSMVIAGPKASTATQFTPEEAFDQQRRVLQNQLARQLDENGLMDPDVALAYNELGKVLEEEGRLDEAFELFQKRLEIEKEVFGCDDHPQMGSTYHNIGFVFRSQGNYEEAMVQYQKALSICLKAHGPEHPETAATYREMGIVLSDQGRYEEAMEQSQKSLAIGLKVDGPEHPSTGITYGCIGNVLENQGKYEEAMEQYQKALAINLKAPHGPEHPETGVTYHSMGTVLERQGRYEEAMEQYQKALAIELRAHGPEHPSTGITYGCIGNVLENQGKYEEAMEQYQKALKIDLVAHGPEHPDTGVTYHSIGNVLFNQDKYEEAMLQYQKALAIKLKVHGPEHPETATTYHCMANVLKEQGKYEEAMAQYKKVLGIHLRAHGPQHPETGATYHSMGTVFEEQGEYKEAIKQYQRALNIFFKAYGPEHPETEETYRDFQHVLQKQSKYEQPTVQSSKEIAINLNIQGLKKDEAIASVRNRYTRERQNDSDDNGGETTVDDPKVYQNFNPADVLFGQGAGQIYKHPGNVRLRNRVIETSMEYEGAADNDGKRLIAEARVREVWETGGQFVKVKTGERMSRVDAIASVRSRYVQQNRYIRKRNNPTGNDGGETVVADLNNGQEDGFKQGQNRGSPVGQAKKDLLERLSGTNGVEIANMLSSILDDAAKAKKAEDIFHRDSTKQNFVAIGRYLKHQTKRLKQQGDNQGMVATAKSSEDDDVETRARTVFSADNSKVESLLSGFSSMNLNENFFHKLDIPLESERENGRKKYYGTTLDGHPHGIGLMEYKEEKKILWGHWRKGILHGLGGGIFFRNNHRCFGLFSKNQLNGKGIYITYYYRYIGNFKNHKKDGYGYLTQHKKGAYVGNFRNGKFEGQGKYTFNNGTVLEGEFKDGELVEQDRHQHHQDLVTVGDLDNEQEHGLGHHPHRHAVIGKESLPLGDVSMGVPRSNVGDGQNNATVDNAVADLNNEQEGGLEQGQDREISLSDEKTDLLERLSGTNGDEIANILSSILDDASKAKKAEDIFHRDSTKQNFVAIGRYLKHQSKRLKQQGDNQGMVATAKSSEDDDVDTRARTVFSADNSKVESLLSGFSSMSLDEGIFDKLDIPVDGVKYEEGRKKYYGTTLSGHPHGLGFMEYKEEKKILWGHWRKGILHGFGGVIFFRNNHRCFGLFSKNQLNGKGIYITDAYRYIGDFKHHKKDGHGYLKQHTRGTYVGNFRNGKFEGQGKYTFNNGTFLEGEFKDGKHVVVP